ncbi:MAG: copper resistance protein CopC, partial [Thermoleophilaceae bacterium]
MRARVGGTALVPALIAAWLLALAPSAHAHAELMGTTPPDGAVLKRQPELVTFHFGEPVEAGLGAVRVMDARGRRADDGSLVHPRAGTSDIGTRLRPGLPQGTYTTSYRVVSDDGHVVSGSSSFSVGRRSAEAAAPAGRGMTGHRRARPAESVAFGVARGATYLATALIVGLLAFL